MNIIFLLLGALFVAPAAAQDAPPQGIGFAQAEEGTWLCRHEQPEEALACAREQCSEQAPGQECWATAWCFPANWSGLMTVWLEDFHTTHVLCGAPSEAALTQGLAAICAGDEAAVSCDITLVIDPAGVELPVEGQSFAGPAAPSPPASGETAEPAQAGPLDGEPTRQGQVEEETPGETPAAETGEAPAAEAGEAPTSGDGSGDGATGG